MNLSNLILFAFSTVGLTNILIYGKIFEGLREKLRDLVPPKVYEVLECYQCTGFWSGLFTGFIVSHNPFAILMCGFASSFLAESVQVVRDYLEANSMVNIPVQQIPQGEYILDEVAIRADLPPHPTAVSNNNKLNIFYTSQEVLNEILEVKEKVENMVSFHPLDRQPILPGTVTGTIYMDSIAVQTFIISESGIFTLSKVGVAEQLVLATKGVMDHESGEVILFFSRDFSENLSVVVSYEYNMEGC
jgi:hypothetical protein